ncbi:hypothetical protein SDRG_02886 [Saprolegnia diclina VS20]|uniref:Uncharacterized protein n=1 Tax=Saprolegnia diclina (strain VS20) TaxID=1156394 RepID=T0S530_SAPDV|nr:hypothetical protein SDRG_02886 [Saprolegnia diclina VS20]EQC40238.1 hypothetical protein SDRG_02886 [Saprolegnia diclina VS20]|eukprot:XP_008606712.1 hypothetical protein SDRG_02886 [Saprolegnia diclina VS20]
MRPKSVPTSAVRPFSTSAHLRPPTPERRAKPSGHRHHRRAPPPNLPLDTSGRFVTHDPAPVPATRPPRIIPNQESIHDIIATYRRMVLAPTVDASHPKAPARPKSAAPTSSLRTTNPVDFTSSVLSGQPVPIVRMPDVPVLFAKIGRRPRSQGQRPASATAASASSVDELGKRRVTIRMTHLGLS